MKTTLDKLAPEVIYNIFSFLSYSEVYPVVSVCKKFEVMVQYHMYQRMRCLNETVRIELEGSKGRYIELVPVNYDPVQKVIEFVPKDQDLSLSLVNTSGKQWSAFHRLLKIHFSGWFYQKQENQEVFKSLDPQDQAMMIYHDYYNSSIEKTYELPSWNKSSEIKGDCHDRYLGDQGLILSMSYDKSEYYDQLNYKAKQTQPYHPFLPYTSLPYYNSKHNGPSSVSPRLKVSWLRVTFEWIISGLIKEQQKQHIYKERFDALDTLLKKEGCFKYDPSSEPILDYITQHYTPLELPPHLITYVKSHTHECHTPLSRLKHLLEGSGIHSDILWKYTFAKSYVVGNGLLCEEDIVRRIQDSEQEWSRKKKIILKSI